MDTVFKFLFEFLGQFFGSLWSIITGLFGGVGNAFDFSAYVNIINAYTTEPWRPRMGNCDYCHCASGCCACTLRMAYCRRCKKVYSFAQKKKRYRFSC